MENSMILSRIQSSLPSFSNGVAYSKRDNMLVSSGFSTSCAYYYQGGRCSDKLAIIFNRATGYCREFLNSVLIYGSDGNGGKVLLAQVNPSMGWFWSEETTKNVTVRLLKDVIGDKCTVMGIAKPSDRELEDLASQWYGDTVRMTAEFGRMLTSQRTTARIEYK